MIAGRYCCTIAVTASLAAGAAGEPLPATFTEAARREKLAAALPQVEAYMTDRFAELGVPGMAYAVVLDGEVVLSKGLGLRDLSIQAPVDGNSVFRIASMTKSFTAMAILKLRDAGKLALDDPVARHVPEVASWTAPTRDAAPLTVRHLLAHTGGLPEDNPSGDRTLALPNEAFSRWLQAGVPFASATGSEFEYSNLGYMLLGRVVSAAAGRPYQTYVSEEILQPLGMRSTYWAPSAVPRQTLALGYRRDGERWLPEPMLDDGAGAPMGGLMSSVNDMSRFIAMMLAAWPARDDPETAPLSRASLREMQSGQGHPMVVASRQFPGTRLVGRSTSYGHGLFSSADCRWGREVEHSGGLPGFESDMRWLPERGVGVVVLANTPNAGTWRSTYEILGLLQDSGGLDPRRAQPSPAFVQAAQAVSKLIVDWRDEDALLLAADNLFLDEPLLERKHKIEASRRDLGSCKLGSLQAENAMRGSFRIDCERGRLDAALSLSPTQPPRVQYLQVTVARPLSPALRQAAETTTAAIARGVGRLRLAPKTARADLAAHFEATRLTYGSCVLGEVLESDGISSARLHLNCDRGALQLRLSIDKDRIVSARASKAGASDCVP